MPGTLVIIPADPEKPLRDEHYESKRPSLERLQAAVGGWIESVPGKIRHEGRLREAYCNEEGKLEGLRPNKRATEASSLGFTDVLVGDVVIVVPAKRKE